jgi:hypothetical protein
VFSKTREVQNRLKFIELLLFQSLAFLAQVYQNANAFHVLSKQNHVAQRGLHGAQSFVYLLLPRFVLFERSEAMNQLVSHSSTLEDPVVEYQLR